MLLDTVVGEQDTVVVERGYGVPVHPDDRAGFSERYIRSKLEGKGWEVWRGGFLHANRKREVYPNVERRYAMAERLLDDRISALQYIGVVHHGMPDLLCYKFGRFKFVECKLGYEAIRDNQVETISLLQGLGFDVEVHRVVEHATQRRQTRYDVASGDRLVLDEQSCLSSYA